MDYSYYYPSILFMYFGTFIGVIVFIIMLSYVDISCIRNYIKLKEFKRLVGVIISSVCVALLVIFSIRFFKDLPNVINNNYLVVTGTVVTWDTGGTASDTRGITLETDDGELIKATVNYTPMGKGERYEIILLPNSSYGSVIRKIE